MAERGKQPLGEVKPAREPRAAPEGAASPAATQVRALRDRLGRPEVAREALPWAQRWTREDPGSREAVEALAEAQTALGLDTELRASLEHLDALTHGAARAGVRRRLGALHAAHGRTQAAIEAYQGAWEAEAGDLEALDALLPLLERAGRFEDLARTLRRRADLLDAPRRRECLDGLARLLAERLGRIDAAIEVLREIGGGRQAGPRIESRLEELLARAGRHVELEQLLGERRQSFPDGSPEALRVDLRRAQLLADPLQRPAEALPLFREVLRHQPDCADAVSGLEQALRATEDVTGLAEWLAARARRSGDDAQRAALILERAELLARLPGRAEEARRSLRALAEGSTPTGIARRAEVVLLRLLERDEEWAELRTWLESRLGRGSVQDDLSLRRRLARLCRTRLKDVAAAARHLAAAAAIAPDAPELWRELATTAQAQGEPATLLVALEAELANHAPPERARELLARAAWLCAGVLEDAERAEALYVRLLELDPANVEALSYVARRCEESGRGADAARLLERKLAALETVGTDAPESTAEALVELRLRVARLRAREQDGLPRAIDVLEPAAARDETAAWVAEPLAELYRRAGRTEPLAALCRRAARLCVDVRERSAWQLRLGVALETLGDDDGAAEAYRRSLSDQPLNPEAEKALQALYRRRGEREPLARLLETMLRRLSGPEEIPLRRELAELLSGEPGRADAARVHLHRALELEPSDHTTLQRALQLAAGPGRGADRLALLDTALATARGTARAELLLKRARVLSESLDRPREGAAALQEALRLDATLDEARRLLGVLSEQLGDWSTALDSLWRHSESARDEEQTALLDRMGEIACSRLPAHEAVVWLERLLARGPERPDWLERLCQLHRGAGRHAALERTLARRAQHESDAVRRRDLHLERASILERELEDAWRAAGALEAARAAAPGDAAVLRELARVYAATGRPREQARVLETLLETTKGGERIATLAALAGLCSGTLDAPVHAAALLKEACELARQEDRPCLELLQARARALREAGALGEWTTAAEQELECLDAEAPVFFERRLQLHRELAHAYEALGRSSAALVHWRAAVDGRPSVDGQPADRATEDAESALLERLRAGGSAFELARRLETRLKRRPEDAEGWLELARLQSERLAQPAAAARAYREVLARAPLCRPALRGLRDVSQRLGDWEEVASALERELGAAEGAPAAERAALLRRLGEVQWRRLRSSTRAVRAFSTALELDPRDRVALRSVQQLLETVEDWRGALDAYRREIHLLGSDERRRCRALWLRVAKLARERIGDTEQVVGAYEAAARLGPLRPEHRRALAEGYAERGDQEAFVRTFTSLCDDPTACAGCPDQLRLSGALEALGRTREALERAERALALDAQDSLAWEAVARLRCALGDTQGAARANARAARHSREHGAAEQLHRAAALLEAERPEEAAQLLRRAVARDPAAGAAHAALCRVTARLGRRDEATRTARRALDLDDASPQLDAADRLETALVGGRAALECGKLEAAARLAAAALEAEPTRAETLELTAEVRFALGDLRGTRSALETHLGQEPLAAGRPLHLAMLGSALEEAGEPERALAFFRAALEGDERLALAHAGVVRVLEACEDLRGAVAALERWAGHTADAHTRAEQWTRAAQLERAAGGEAGADLERVEARLRRALAADAGHAPAWKLLAELLVETDRPDGALEAATRGRETTRQPQVRSQLSQLRAQLLVARGALAEAAQAYGEAVVDDPRCVAAALEQARLLRTLGAWRAASEALETFVARHPGGDGPALGLALEQLGRLHAGPLEDIHRAIAVYRKALRVDPQRVEVAEALADALANDPNGSREALERQSEILARRPCRPASLRAVLRIARAQGASSCVADGLALLRALGIAGPDEQADAPSRLTLRVSHRAGIEDALGERLRRIVQDFSQELADALGASSTPAPATSNEPRAAFRSAALTAEGHVSTAALVPLSAEDVSMTLQLLAQLAFEPDEVRGDGHLVNALSEALGRRARRRMRRLLSPYSAKDVEALDVGAWRASLRELAHTAALDACEGRLRPALCALIEDEADLGGHEWPDQADLTPYVEACAGARRFLTRVVRAWVESVRSAASAR